MSRFSQTFERLAATIEAKLYYGSGGTTVKAWVQVTLDDGAHRCANQLYD